METAEDARPYIAITLPNGAIYGRSLKPAGTDWEKKDFQPIFMQDKPVIWSDRFPVNAPFHASSGLGDLAVVDLDNNRRPELIFLRVDADTGDNAHNVRPDGTVSGTDWTEHGIFAKLSNTSAAGIATARINNNDRPDLVFFYTRGLLAAIVHEQSPAAISGVYRIGWDVQADGKIAGSWQNFPFGLPPEVFVKPVHGSAIALADCRVS